MPIFKDVFHLNSLHNLVIYFWIGFLFTNVVHGNLNTEDYGCNLKHASSVQSDLLSFLRENNFFGQTFTYVGVNNIFEYHFTVCGYVIKERPNVMLVRRNKNQSLKDATGIGLRNITSISGEKGKWMILNLLEAEIDDTVCKNVSLSSSVMFMCDPDSSSGDFKLVYEDQAYCTFLFELRMAALCGELPGMSGWLVFFIIAFVAFLFYFIIGVIYLRVQKNARGIDQIPNRHFWFTVGNKLADGCSAFCRCDQYCTDSIDHLESSHSPYSGGYSPISEGLPATISSHNSERDAPMLKP